LPDVNGCAIDQTLPAERRSRQRFCAHALAARRANTAEIRKTQEIAGRETE
jgi:hypothetical protein